MTKKNVFHLFLILFIFLIDRLSKLWVVNYFNLVEKSEINISPFLSINLMWNQGIAFGLFSFNESVYYNLLTSFIVFVTFIVFIMIIKTKGIEKYSFIMIFGGSLGNIFDRLIYSEVPDFIDLHYGNFHWFIFNVADIFISVGVILLILKEFIFKTKN